MDVHLASHVPSLHNWATVPQPLAGESDTEEALPGNALVPSGLPMTTVWPSPPLGHDQNLDLQADQGQNAFVKSSPYALLSSLQPVDTNSREVDEALPTTSQAVPSGLPYPAFCPDLESDSGIAPADLFGAASKVPQLSDNELLSEFATNSSSVDTPAEALGLSVPASTTLSAPVQLQDPDPSAAMPLAKLPSTAPMVRSAVQSMQTIFHRLLSPSGPGIQGAGLLSTPRVAPRIPPRSDAYSSEEGERQWTDLLPSLNLLDVQNASALSSHQIKQNPLPSSSQKPIQSHSSPSSSIRRSSSDLGPLTLQGSLIPTNTSPRPRSRSTGSMGTGRRRNQPYPSGRPFVCPTCGRGFDRKSNLRQHMQVHDPNRERPFVCPLPWCKDRAFSRKNDCHRHIFKCHISREPLTKDHLDLIHKAHPSFNMSA